MVLACAQTKGCSRGFLAPGGARGRVERVLAGWVLAGKVRARGRIRCRSPARWQTRLGCSREVLAPGVCSRARKQRVLAGLLESWAFSALLCSAADAFGVLASTMGARGHDRRRYPARREPVARRETGAKGSIAGRCVLARTAAAGAPFPRGAERALFFVAKGAERALFFVAPLATFAGNSAMSLPRVIAAYVGSQRAQVAVRPQANW